MHFVFSYVRNGLLPSDAFLVFYFQKHVDLEVHFFNLCVTTKYVFYSLYSYHASKFFCPNIPWKGTFQSQINDFHINDVDNRS